MSDHEHEHFHEHTHEHTHADGTVHSHPHEHTHTHEYVHDHGEGHEHTHEHLHEHEDGHPAHEHSHDHDHPHEHPHEHPHDHHHGEAPQPMEQLFALMKYMAGHNADHTRELEGLAGKAKEAGADEAYDLIMEAVRFFDQGNEALAKALEKFPHA